MDSTYFLFYGCITDIGDQEFDNPDICGCAILPGKNLDLSAIIRAKKFKSRGNKPAALEAFKTLQEAGIGTLEELGSARRTAMVGYKCTLTVNHYTVKTV